MQHFTLIVEAYPFLRAMQEQDGAPHAPATEPRVGWVRRAGRLFRPVLRTAAPATDTPGADAAGAR